MVLTRESLTDEDLGLLAAVYSELEKGYDVKIKLDRYKKPVVFRMQMKIVWPDKSGIR